jgi:hypothetical protein
LSAICFNASILVLSFAAEYVFETRKKSTLVLFFCLQPIEFLASYVFVQIVLWCLENPQLIFALYALFVNPVLLN